VINIHPATVNRTYLGVIVSASGVIVSASGVIDSASASENPTAQRLPGPRLVSLHFSPLPLFTNCQQKVVPGRREQAALPAAAAAVGQGERHGMPRDLLARLI
jgi:hypothetical protein